MLSGIRVQACSTASLAKSTLAWLEIKLRKSTIFFDDAQKHPLQRISQTCLTTLKGISTNKRR